MNLRVTGFDAYALRIIIQDEYPTSVAWSDTEGKVSLIHAKDVYPDYPALRALEILAYGFFDYSARECLCYQPDAYFDLTGCIDQEYSVDTAVDGTNASLDPVTKAVPHKEQPSVTLRTYIQAFHHH